MVQIISLIRVRDNLKRENFSCDLLNANIFVYQVNKMLASVSKFLSAETCLLRYINSGVQQHACYGILIQERRNMLVKVSEFRNAEPCLLRYPYSGMQNHAC